MRLRSVLAAVILLPALLSGCMTADHAEGPAMRDDRLLPQPLRTVGLTFHHVGLATGSYALDAGAAADIAPGATENVRRACSGRQPAVTWLGHSSAILYVGGRCLLTDPVLETVMSPLSPLSTRLVDNPIRVEHLPPIDAIILSHGDYDHLHMPTITALARRFPDAEVIVPPGVAGAVILSGYPRVTRVALGETTRINGIRITAAHAYHGTRRNLTAIRTGEAFSWIVSDGRKKILFIGDSGYGPTFREIGRIHGPFDMLLVPIGAYEPRQLVADMHVDPEEAARIARDVRARLAVAIHWGTFALSPDRPGDSVRRFRDAGRQLGVQTRVLAIGGTARVP